MTRLTRFTTQLLALLCLTVALPACGEENSSSETPTSQEFVVANADELSAADNKCNVQDLATPSAKCDCLAGDPDDRNRRATGVVIRDIEKEAAVKYCKWAYQENPKDKIIEYQLLRARLKGQMLSKQIDVSILEKLKNLGDGGYSAAYVLLADIHGIPQLGHYDLNLQTHYLREAGNLYDPVARRKIGIILIKRRENRLDQFEGIRSLTWAAEKGDVLAQFALGVEYDFRGQLDDAAYWYEKSAQLGNTTAMIKLFNLYGRRDDPGDIDRAFKWLDQAIRDGNEAAYKRLVLWARTNPREVTEVLIKKYPTLTNDLKNYMEIQDE